MKFEKKITAAFILLLPLGISFAETPTATDAPGKGPAMTMGMGKHRGMGMMMSPEERDTHLRAAQEHMLQMHDLSTRILAESDPKKKDQLKNEQLQLMKAHHEQMMAQRMEKMQMHHQSQGKPANKPAK